MFLAFHPSQVHGASTNGAKLPLTVYESVYEGEHASENGKAMQVDGEEQSLNIRFREIPYFVETGEAEMIGMDTVARTARTGGALSQVEKKDAKEPSAETVVYSPEEEERTLPSPSPRRIIVNMCCSDGQPQHPLKRYSHAGVPHLIDQIVSVEYSFRGRHRSRKGDALAPYPAEHQRAAVSSVPAHAA